MKTYMYGPVNDSRSIIRQVNANVYSVPYGTDILDAPSQSDNLTRMMVTVTPDPINADPEDAYGFDTVIQYYPEE
jgi:hypothetical protein